MAYNASHRTARDPFIKGGKVIAFEVLAAKKIMKGDIVRLTTAGYALAGDGATSLAQGDTCAGIALETVDNTLSEGKKVRCLTEGVISLIKAVPAASDLGTRATYAAAAATTVASAATNLLVAASGADDMNNEVHVGMVVGLADEQTSLGITNTKLRVKLQTLRQAYQ